MWQIINGKIQGKEVIAPQEPVVNVIDLMEALRKSLSQAGVAQ